MKAARCAPALCGGKPNDLAAGTASHRLNFLAARLNGAENHPKRPGIRRMSAITPNVGGKEMKAKQNVFIGAALTIAIGAFAPSAEASWSWKSALTWSYSAAECT